MKKVLRKSILLITIFLCFTGCGDDKKKMASAESSALSYVDAVEKQYMLSQIDSEAIKMEPGRYIVKNLTELGVNAKGNEARANGVVIIDTDGAVDEAWLQFGDYKVYYNGTTAKALGKNNDWPSGKSKNKDVSYKSVSDLEKETSIESNLSENETGDNTQSISSNENTSVSIAEHTPSNNYQELQNTTPSVSVSKQNALRSAKDYLNTMAFSRQSLIEQLEYEKYSYEDAVYAVDNCGADWNQQAARSAKDYLNTMPFSRDGLIEQLEYEGFTREQAEYGVNSVGL